MLQIDHLVHVPLPLSLEKLLRNNHGWCMQATKWVAELAEGMPRLRGFVHVSTAYVNAHHGRGSHIEEDIYPLYLSNGQAIRHDSLAAELAALPHAKAERKVGHVTHNMIS